MKLATLLTSFFVVTTITCFSQLVPEYYESHYKYAYTNTVTGETGEPEFDQAYPFNGNVALVKKDSYMLIDTTFTTLRTFSYNNMRPVEGTDYYSFQELHRVGFVNADGTVRQEWTADTLVQWYPEADGYVIFQNGKLGIFTMARGLVMPIEFECESFWSTFNWDGYLYFQDGSSFVLKRNGKWGVMNMYNGVIVPFEYENIHTHEAWYTVKRDGKWAFYNLSVFKALTGFDYDELFIERDDHIGARKDGKWALLDIRTLKPLTKFEFDGYLGRYKSPQHNPDVNSPYVFMKNGELLFYDLGNKKFIEQAQVTEEKWRIPDHMITVHNGKQGVISRDKKIILGFEYDKISESGTLFPDQNASTFVVTKNGSTGLFVPGRGLVFPMTEGEYITVMTLHGQIFYGVSRGGKFALYNTDQKPVTGFLYDSMYVVEDVITIHQGDKEGTLSMDGVATWNE